MQRTPNQNSMDTRTTRLTFPCREPRTKFLLGKKTSLGQGKGRGITFPLSKWTTLHPPLSASTGAGPLVTTLSPPFADRTAGTHLSDPEPSNLDRTDHSGSNTSMSGLTAWPRPARRACRRRPCPNRPQVRWLATKEC
jgi:hypothetical protein